MGACKESIACGVAKQPASPIGSTQSPVQARQIQYYTEHHRHTATDDAESMHPIIAAAFHNRTKSPLCRLPDAILVRLMQLSDRVTVECLRPCSRTFLRLFPAACADARDFTTRHADQYPWPTSELRWLPGEKQTFISLLERDVYCEDCREARRSTDWQARVAALTRTYLHCSGCRADHPACLFSARERKRASQSERICIGHEGHMRLCKHAVVPWSLVCSEAEKRLRKEPRADVGFATLMRCTRSKHVRTCRYRSWPLSLVLSPLRVLFDLPRADINCPPSPTVHCRFEKNAFELRVVWSCHVPSQMRLDRRFSAGEVASRMGELYGQQGRFICPQIKPGPVVGSALCDPGRCDCVRYAERSMTIPWERPAREWRTSATCRLDPVFGLGSNSPRAQSSRRRCYRHSLVDDTSDGFFAHTADIAVCQGGKNCIVATYQSRMRFALGPGEDYSLRRMNRGWYQALDPDSYGLTDDTDGFGLFWCKTEKCRNYYRLGWSRLAGFLNPADCLHECPLRDSKPHLVECLTSCHAVME